MQPDDEVVEEEFEVEEVETKSTARPASKMDLEEPVATPRNGEKQLQEEDNENAEEVIVDK